MAAIDQDTTIGRQDNRCSKYQLDRNNSHELTKPIPSYDLPTHNTHHNRRLNKLIPRSDHVADDADVTHAKQEYHNPRVVKPIPIVPKVNIEVPATGQNVNKNQTIPDVTDDYDSCQLTKPIPMRQGGGV